MMTEFQEALLPIVQAITAERGRCTDNWTVGDVEDAKRRLGPSWSHMSSDDVRHQAINLRKSGKVGPVGGGHGPGSGAAKPIDLGAPILSDGFQGSTHQFRLPPGFWPGRTDRVVLDGVVHGIEMDMPREVPGDIDPGGVIIHVRFIGGPVE